MVVHDSAVGDSFLIAYNLVLATTGQTMCSHLIDLMAAYFAFDINYPKQYQLLGVLQTELLNDMKSAFFRSVAYVKFITSLSG